MTELVPAPFAAPTTVDLETAPLVVIEHPGVSIPDLDDLFNADYAVLDAAAEAGAYTIAGPPLAVYEGDPRERFTARIGYPVASPAAAPSEGDGPVPWQLPSGSGLALTHIGGYEGLSASWGRLAQSADRPPTGEWMEVYVTEPATTPPDERRTDLYLMLQPAP